MLELLELGWLEALWRVQKTSRWRSWTAFWVLLFLVCGTRAFLGLEGVDLFAHDAFMVLDGAWRMLNGQRPHIDFNSMVGPAAYLPTVIGFQMSGKTAAGFAYGQALVGMVAGVWALCLGRKLSVMPRTVYALCVACIAASPALLGPSPLEITPGMTYNRYTYSLLGLLLLECLSPNAEHEFAGGFSSGAVLGLASFTKMTGLVIGVLLLLMLVPVRRQSRFRWVGLAAGYVVTAMPFLVYLHFDVIAMLHDLALTAAAKHIRFFERFDLASLFFEAGLALCLVVASASLLARSGHASQARAWFYAGAVTIGVSVVMIFGNFQRSGFPLITLFLIVTADLLLRSPGTISADCEYSNRLILGATTVFVVTTLGSTALSLLISLELKYNAVPRSPRFIGPGLKGFVPVSQEVRYTGFVNDGMRLLERYRRPGEHVMSLDFANPFALGFWIPPAAGGSTNLQFRGSFDYEHKLTPERLFGCYELVMVPYPNYSDDSLTNVIPEIYGPYLTKRYQLIGQTKKWQLYRRVPLGTD